MFRNDDKKNNFRQFKLDLKVDRRRCERISNSKGGGMCPPPSTPLSTFMFVFSIRYLLHIQVAWFQWGVVMRNR